MPLTVLVVRLDVRGALNPCLYHRWSEPVLTTLPKKKIPLIAFMPSSPMYSIPVDAITWPAAMSRKSGYGTKFDTRDMNFASTMNHFGLASSDFCVASGRCQRGMMAAYRIIIWVITVHGVNKDSLSNNEQLTDPTRYLRKLDH
jgi:hypothetical protein